MNDLFVVPLTRGAVALVDAADAEIVQGYTWYLSKRQNCAYACRRVQTNGKARTIYLHRVIANPADNEVVDHKNHDGLDNRRANLRNCTQGANLQNRRSAQSNNSHGHYGIWRKRQRWVASIQVAGKRTYLGYFKTVEEALAARREAEQKMVLPLGAD
jgi:hypothetical protein